MNQIKNPDIDEVRKRTIPYHQVHDHAFISEIFDNGPEQELIERVKFNKLIKEMNPEELKQ